MRGFVRLHTDAPINWAGYKSPKFDGLIDQARSMPALTRRGSDYANAFTTLHNDLPILYLYSPRVLFGMSAKVQGFAPVADGMMRLDGVTLAK